MNSSESERMRVLVIGSAHALAMEQWVTEMLHRGHEIRVLSPYRPRDAIAHLTGSTEGGLRLPFVGFALRMLKIRREVREFRPDLVHAHGALNYALWAVLSGFPRVLVTCWGSDVLLAPARSALGRWKVRYALRRAGYVTATSRTLLQEAQAVAGLPLRGEVLHWGVDLEAFASGDRPPGTGVTFLSTRGHTSLYNVDVIIRAFGLLRDDHPQARLLVAHKGELTDELEHLVHDLGLADTVDFLGWVEEAELPRLYGNADVYISVPSSDASAVSNLEAMASGCAVIVSDLPSSREWVDHEVSGLVVPANDVEALHDAMRSLAGDQALRARLGRAARKVVEERGSRDSQMNRAAQLYRELAEESAS